MVVSKDIRSALTGKPEQCMGLTVLELHDAWPRLPLNGKGLSAVGVSDLRLRMADSGSDIPLLTGNYSLCASQSPCNTQPGVRLRPKQSRECMPVLASVRVGMFIANLDAWGPVGTTPPPIGEQGCTYTFDTPIIAYSRVLPRTHLGHRMLTDLPALWGLKLYLENILGISAAELPLVFTDFNADPPWGARNFQPMLEAIGFKSFHTNGAFDATWCAPHAILVGSEWWLHKYIDEKGSYSFMWDRPDKLWDTDSTTIEMVEAVRKQVGLHAPLPFAPLHPQRIVFASRDPALRKDAKQVAKRQFLNEGQLAEKLRSRLPGVIVEQQEFGGLTLEESIRVLQNTSMLIGYHGAALDLNFWLPRGAYMMELFPKGSNHAPLYSSKAALSGKQFITWVSDDWNTQTCAGVRGCGNASRSQMHNADMMMSEAQMAELVEDVAACLRSQRLTLRRRPSHWMRHDWEEVQRAQDEVTASKLPSLAKRLD